MQRGRKGLLFDWFDWMEFALTWQVSEQDEIYRKKMRREREIAVRSVNINQVLLSYTWFCIERTGEWSSSSWNCRSFITGEEGMGLHNLTFIVLFDIHKNSTCCDPSCSFSFFYSSCYCLDGVNWAVERWHFNVCEHVMSDLLLLNYNDGS
jgi:hypothetical protein